MVNILSETLVEKTKTDFVFSFASGYKLKIASLLEMGALESSISCGS